MLQDIRNDIGYMSMHISTYMLVFTLTVSVYSVCGVCACENDGDCEAP